LALFLELFVKSNAFLNTWHQNAFIRLNFLHPDFGAESGKAGRPGKAVEEF
jgi:hypothetical protein